MSYNVTTIYRQTLNKAKPWINTVCVFRHFFKKSTKAHRKWVEFDNLLSTTSMIAMNPL